MVEAHVTLATPPVKVNLCHHTESNTNPWVVQEVNANEVQSHLDNGDMLIDETHPCPPSNPTGTPTITIDPTIVVTPTISLDPTATPSATPSVTPEVTSNDGGAPDGLGCATHPCYVNQSGSPLSPPSQSPK